MGKHSIFIPHIIQEGLEPKDDKHDFKTVLENIGKYL